MAATLAFSVIVAGLVLILNDSDDSDAATVTFSNNGLTYSGSNGKATVTGYEGTPSTITIPNTVTYGGTTYSVTTITSKALYNCTSVTTLTIGANVTTINAQAFTGCSNLTNVFYNAVSATTPTTNTTYFGSSGSVSNGMTVSVGSGVTKIPRLLFASSNIKSISIPSNVTSIDGMAFENCKRLTSVSLAASTAASIGSSAFSGCTGLTQFTIPAGYKTIGTSAFSGCTGLTTLTIGADVATINSGAFNNCTSLRTVNYNAVSATTPTTSTTYFGSSGSVSNGMTVIVGDGVTKIPRELFKSSNISIIRIPASLKTIENNAFENCARLATVEVSCISTLSITAGSSGYGGIALNAVSVVKVHNLTHYPTLPATCTASGYNEYDRCQDCGYTTKVVLYATGHDYSATYEWAADGSSCTVRLVCANDAAHNATLTPVVTSSVKTPATCTSAGITTYTVMGAYNGYSYYSTKDVQDIPARGHAYSATYDWAADGSSCTVVLVCANDSGHNTQIDADVNSARKADPTCLENGITTYSVSGTYDGFAYSSSKDVADLPAIGHDYSATYEWAADGSSCIVHITCANDAAHNHDIDADATSSVKVPATCTSMGTTMYSVSGTYDGFAYSSSMDIIDIPASHAYSATYDWAADGSSCTVHIVCANDAGHNHDIENVVSQGSVKTPAACTAMGTTTYSISGTYDGFDYSDTTDVVDIPAIGHDYSATYEWAADGSSCTVHIVCANDAAHNHDIENVASEGSVKTPAACAAMGTTTYSVSGTYDGFVYYDTKDVVDIAAIGHDYSATYEWAANGSSCIVHMTCANDAAHNHDVDATVGSSVKIPATCTSMGTTLYSVSGTYDGFAYYDTKDIIDIAPIGHDYSATYEWAADGSSCTVRLVCANDAGHNHDIENVASEGSVKIPAACTAMGTTTYSVSGTYDGFVYYDTKDVVDIAAIGHDYSATYEWAADGSSCIVHITCANDAGHNHDVDAGVVSSVRIPATCTAMGTTTYSVSGTYSGFAYSDTTDVIDIDAIGHDYSATYEWAADGSSCIVHITCANDAAHNYDLDAAVSSSVKTDATAVSMGITTYLVDGIYDGFAYSSTKDITDIPVLEPAVSQKDVGGTVTYANTVAGDLTTQVTDIFRTAKTNSGAVEVSVPSAATDSPVTIAFDSAAVNAIGGNDVSITVSVSGSSASVPGAELVVEVNLDGAAFTQGKAKVTVPIKETVPNGKVVKVYFIDGDTKVDMNATLVDGNAVFETSHFSTYALFFEDAPSENTGDNGGGEFPAVYLAIVGIAILALAGGAIVFMRRH